MLRIEHLTKAYGEKKAVDDLNLHIAPGEIYGFIGHNGAGKTTTLKSVAGILQFDAGEIYIDGKSIRTQPLECKRSFAYIPDNPDLYEYMTVAIMLGAFGSVFNTYAGPYLPKDNDLLLSMPIPVSSLVAARAFPFYR